MKQHRCTALLAIVDTNETWSSVARSVILPLSFVLAVELRCATDYISVDAIGHWLGIEVHPLCGALLAIRDTSRRTVRRTPAWEASASAWDTISVWSAIMDARTCKVYSSDAHTCTDGTKQRAAHEAMETAPR